MNYYAETVYEIKGAKWILITIVYFSTSFEAKSD